MDETLLETIEDGVFRSDQALVCASVEKTVAGSYDRDKIVRALAGGVEKARMRFGETDFSLPEFLLCIDAFRQGGRILQQQDPDFLYPAASEGKPKIVIGVIEGDVHDLGKNIVAAVLEASGYPVIDAGNDVPADVFLKYLEESGASVLAISTMMSTTLDNIRNLIARVRDRLPHVCVIVGGAPFDDRLAGAVGADGYAENAISIPEETRRVTKRLEQGK